MTPPKWLLLQLAVFSLSQTLMASTHYVWCGASGSANGTSFTNAYTDLPSSLSRGDTYVVAGSGSCTYAYNHHFQDSESGTSVITIRHASSTLDGGVSGFQSSFATKQAVWNMTMLSQIWYVASGSGYYTFDGNPDSDTGAASTTCGSICGFLLKSNLGSLTGNIFGVLLGGGPGDNSNIIFRHIEIDMTGTSLGSSGNEAATAFYNNQTDVSGLVVDHCYIHDIPGNVISMQTGPAKTGLTVEHSLIARTYGNSANHGSTINFTNYQGVELFHNVFIDNQTNIAEAINTCSGCTNTADFYGNVVWQQNAISLSSVLACVDSPEVCHWNAFNNTIANVTVGTAFFTTSSAGAGSTIVSYNNLFWNDTNGAGGGTTSDYNCYESSSVYPSETHSCVGGANYFTNSSTGDFHLASETPSNPNGFNTNSLLPANAQDPDGVNRSTADGGTWSRGAFEDPSQAQGLTPPSGLTAVVN